MIRALRIFGYSPRRRIFCYLFLLSTVLSAIIVSCISLNFPKENQLEENIAGIQARLEFLESLYRARQEDILVLKGKLQAGKSNYSNPHTFKNTHKCTTPSHATGILKRITEKEKLSSYRRHMNPLRNSFAYQLMPHLMDHSSSLRPAYLVTRGRQYSDVVIGIPTVKRDKESYIIQTLTSLIESLSEEERKNTLIVVYIGETDIEFVVKLASQIESMFTQHVKHGLIEIISPSPYYYPDLDNLPMSLGDSPKRVKWRTKQNLDTIYLMGYAQNRGTFYLMLEDDVIAKKKYMQEIKKFTVATSVSTPNWFFLEFCHVGGIGKLFKSSSLIHFMTYVQLFYKNMPIDWLLESYLADRVCTIDKGSDPKFGSLPLYYPHANPPLKRVYTDINEHSDHTAERAYRGKTYFWGEKPQEGNVIEFWFRKPTAISRYTFRSGNYQHTSDKFYNTAVEVLSARKPGNFTFVNMFDEFGLAEGSLARFGNLDAIRLRVKTNSFYWALLSEIELIKTPRRKPKSNK